VLDTALFLDILTESAGQNRLDSGKLMTKQTTKNEITREVFDHLVKLAAIQLNEEQAQYLLRELNHQLQSIHELEAIPLNDDLPITTHGVPYTEITRPMLREDEWQPFNNPLQIIDQAPQSENGYIAVPDIPHTTLE
jgi:aspartyl-tRNA(Asn)/glutamyl-tRNA(Gln) amidotransferase subunit C